MMTEINRNIDQYNVGIANGFSFRAIICVCAAGVVIASLTFVGMTLNLPTIVSGWIAGFPAILLVYMGIYTKEGFFFEDIIMDKIYRFRCWNLEFEAEEVEQLIENPNDMSLESKVDKKKKK